MPTLPEGIARLRLLLSKGNLAPITTKDLLEAILELDDRACVLEEEALLRADPGTDPSATPEYKVDIE